MKMSGRSEKMPFYSKRNQYRLAVFCTDRTNRFSIVDIVQQPRCDTFKSIRAQLRSEPCRLIIETEDPSTDTRLVFTKGLRQQIRKPSHILFDTCGYVFMPDPSVVGICAKTVYSDDAELDMSTKRPYSLT